MRAKIDITLLKSLAAKIFCPSNKFSLALEKLPSRNCPRIEFGLALEELLVIAQELDLSLLSRSCWLLPKNQIWPCPQGIAGYGLKIKNGLALKELLAGYYPRNKFGLALEELSIIAKESNLTLPSRNCWLFPEIQI